jgi:hypothetical protein
MLRWAVNRHHLVYAVVYGGVWTSLGFCSTPLGGNALAYSKCKSLEYVTPKQSRLW